MARVGDHIHVSEGIKDVYLVVIHRQSGVRVSKIYEEELLKDINDNVETYRLITFKETYIFHELGLCEGVIIHLNTGEIVYPKIEQAYNVELAFIDEKNDKEHSYTP